MACRGRGLHKTSTIAAAIRALVASGARVLVSAYTNSAVDNILIKLAQLQVRAALCLGCLGSHTPRV